MHTGRPSAVGERKDRLRGEGRIRATAANILTLSLLSDWSQVAQKFVFTGGEDTRWHDTVRR